MLLTGLGNLQYKMKIPFGARMTLIACNAVTLCHGLILISVGLYTLLRTSITTDARDYGIVFVAEVPMYAILSFLNLLHLLRPSLRSRFHQWMSEHQVRFTFPFLFRQPSAVDAVCTVCAHAVSVAAGVLG